MKSDDPNFFDVRAKTYVRYVLDELKLSPTALAKEAGLASTTITRALNDPTHKYTLSMSTLAKIFKASGINFNPFFSSNDYPALSLMPYSASDLYDESWGENANAVEDAPNDGDSTIVIGEAALGVWKEERIGRLEDLGAIWVSIPNTRRSEAFALLMADDSGAPYLRKGEYALCKRRKQSDPLLHGTLVVVERWKKYPGMMELSVRRLVKLDNGEAPYLRADNRDEKYAARIVPRPDLQDTDEVKLVGIVIGAFRQVADETMIEEHNAMIMRQRKK